MIESGAVLVADAELPRVGGDNRPVIDVAVGILLSHDGSFLMTSRPKGKVYADYWEFPGGKLEDGETVNQALVRELREEIGICPTRIEAWRQEKVDYPHALVLLHFSKVTAWTGELKMHEGQQYQWQSLPVVVSPVLPGTVPVLGWLARERGFLGATHSIADHVDLQS